ncbi:class I adenylate-forming enzyme family protein [Streptomonospora nanhaiensis]|uniref:class I adenylate-forming enzyme family protein n=1 Tax=Streptomonospora nanhaiensis TaxID=1323731 RepID=UPI001C9924FF|nr:class I adenylate-forming enzyme family protein [Streptomonospora nanhaiensis]MBX9391704.1 acyl--CoA ligase [Streptomonospora nanhaiensis]
MTAAAVTDLVPARLRAEWARRGDYPCDDLFALFSAHADAHPDRPAVIDDGGTLDYAGLRARALATAGGLAALGVRPGEVVCVQLPNGRDAVAAELAVAALGAVALPFPVGRRVRETEALVRGSGAVAAIAPARHRDRSPAAEFAALRGTAPTLRHVVAVGPGPAPEGCVPADGLPPAPPGFAPARPDPDSCARILVSSGSEAQPKMIAYSHNALAGGRGNFVEALRRPGQDLRAMFLVPLGSAFGSSGTSVTLARHGGTLVLCGAFDADAAVRAVAEHRPSHVFAVPTMIRMMLDSPSARTADPGGVSAVVLGGAPLDPLTAAEARARFGCPVVNLYGSADGVNCHTGLDDPPDISGRPGIAAGRPNPRVADIRVVDEELRDVPAGAIGEIVSLGPMTPMCYVGAPELNARYRAAGGWVRTGDLGTLDEDGGLRVVGRLKDVVIRGGANISPAEVEQLLREHPDVRDTCCVGVPDPLMGERLAAHIVPRHGRVPDRAELEEFLRGKGVEPYKFPEYVLPAPAGGFPLTPAGKVDKQRLRERAVEVVGG